MKHLLLLALLLCLLQFPAFARPVSGISGGLELGMSREQVFQRFGKPEIFDRVDLYYQVGKAEIIICFNDATSLVESIIVIGKNSKFSVGGVTVGDLKKKVLSSFGQPEKVRKYSKGKAECYYYPTKNVNFAFDGEYVTSFGVSNCSAN